MSVKSIPEGYHTVTPYIMATGVRGLIDFLKNAFDATVVAVTSGPDGVVLHGEVRIGDSVVMMSEAMETHPARPASFYMYVDNVDALYARAMAAGAVSKLPPEDRFYGDRSAGVDDPCGNTWWIASRIENLSEEEIHRRVAESSNQQS